MDNAFIHTSNEIDELTLSRGYRCVYLPPYSPELNPIKQFWSIVKNKVRRSEFADKDDLRTRITEAYDSVPMKYLKAFVQHSIHQFEKCRDRNHIW
jgi:transposase